MAVAVTPPLLGETLARALRREAIEVVLTEASRLAEEPFDAVLVNDDVECDAPVLVRLPQAEDDGVGSLTVLGHRQPLPLSDVATLVAILRGGNRLSKR